LSAAKSKHVPLVFSLDETCDVGHDTGSPVSDDYRSEDPVGISGNEQPPPTQKRRLPQVSLRFFSHFYVTLPKGHRFGTV